MSLWTSLCEWFEPLGGLLWLNALVIVPLAMLAALISSIPRLRPATRHGAWLVALAWCLLPPVLPAFRVQIDDHTTHTPLSVPRSTDTERIAAPLLSVELPSRFAAKRLSDSPVTDPTEEPTRPIAPVRWRGPHRLASADAPPRPSSWRADSTNPKDRPQKSFGSEARGESEQTSSTQNQGPIIRDRAMRPRPFIFAPYWSTLDLLDADRSCVEREDAVESQAGRQDEVPLPWKPYGQLAFDPLAPAAPAGGPPIGLHNASDVTVASDDSDQRRESIEQAGSQAPGDSTAHRQTQDAPWQDRWVVRPLAGWVGGLLEVRDAIGRLPAMPAQIWLAGMLLTALTFGSLTVVCRRRLRGAYPAPPQVAELVRFAAGRMGLARAPRVMLVDRRMSPMIWCGRRPVLVLPVDLWNELDDSGRHAVIFHELAHLLRRDHWVCRLSIVATCLYWWHPLVWWVRKRIHEEAEMCCDAWVIWHLPSGRRAYADTLLRARRYLSCPSLTPALAMGAVNNQKQKFARRLTMIMTERSRPHRGYASTMLLAALCLAGWAATPAVSSPPPAAPSAPTEVSTPSAPEGVTVLATGPTPPIVVAAPLAPLAAAPPGPDDGKPNAKSQQELRKQMAEIQRQVERLSRKVEELAEATERVDRRVIKGPRRVGPHGDPPFVVVPGTRGNVFSRKYSMPKGKLKVFVKLMARDDVPILISPGVDDVEVRGSAAQHAIIESFVTMINRERKEERQTYELSEGKLRDLTELMIRDDVPIRVWPRDDNIQVIGTPAEQAVFKAFIELIRPDAREMEDLGAFRDAERALQFAKGRSQEHIEAAQYQAKEALAKAHMKEAVVQAHMKEALEQARLAQRQHIEEAKHAYAETLMEAKEHQRQQIEEAQRAYEEAMKKLKKEHDCQEEQEAQ